MTAKETLNKIFECNSEDMFDLMDFWHELFPKITKNDADFLENILNMNEQKKVSFMFAKRAFEEDQKKT